MDPLAVGQTLPPLVLPPIDRTTLALYAGASGDHNPIHIDLDFARKAGMPDVFAQGMLSMAYLGRVLTGWLPQAQLREFSVRFVGITHLQHQLTCTGRVAEVAARGGERQARIELKTANQHGETRILGDAWVAL